MTDNKKLPAKTALMNTLEDLLHKKPFQKISVNELCETAQVSRSAFYANFEDKYHLLSCCLHSKTESLNALTQTLSPEEFLYGVLNYLQEDGRFFHNAFGADLEEESLLILYRFFSHFLTSFLNRRVEQGFVLPGPMEVVVSFYIGGLTSTSLSWIKSNYRLPAKEVAACQYRLLKDILP